MTEQCIRCHKERDEAETSWYSNGWRGHPDWRWYACPDCWRAKVECWDLARAQLAKLLAGEVLS